MTSTNHLALIQQTLVVIKFGVIMTSKILFSADSTNLSCDQVWSFHDFQNSI